MRRILSLSLSGCSFSRDLSLSRANDRGRQLDEVAGFSMLMRLVAPLFVRRCSLQRKTERGFFSSSSFSFFRARRVTLRHDRVRAFSPSRFIARTCEERVMYGSEGIVEREREGVLKSVRWKFLDLVFDKESSRVKQSGEIEFMVL